MRRVRILHVVGRSHRRGAETAALELANGLDDHGHNNRVIALGPAFDGTDDPELPPLTRRVRRRPALLVGSAWRLRRLLDRDAVQVVLAHGGTAAQVAAFARRRGRLPLVVWQRILGFPAPVWRPARERWWRIVAGRIDAAVAITPPLGHELRRLGFDGPVWVIGNTRDPERFTSVDRREAAARLREEAGVADDVPLLGFVGHLVDQKRPERSVAVLARVLAEGQPAHLVVAGDGPLRGRLEHEVRDRDLEAYVTILGHRADVERIYGGLDVLLLTSDAEGVPGVAIEALMAGCPVVTFPLGGVTDVVEHGRTGIVLDAVDTGLMADKVVWLLEHPEDLRRLGDEGRRQAGEFSTHRAAEEYAARLTELYERRASYAR